MFFHSCDYPTHSFTQHPVTSAHCQRVEGVVLLFDTSFVYPLELLLGLALFRINIVAI